MRDHATGSQWLHYTGECIDGAHKGRSLAMLDTTLTTWRAFRERSPDGTIVDKSPSWRARILGLLDSARDVPSFFRLPPWFTRTMRAPQSNALSPMEFGLGVVVAQRSIVGGVRAKGTRFYPFARVRERKLVCETLADRPVLVRWDEHGNSAVAFLAEISGTTPTFSLDGETLVDDRGNRYNASGLVVSGPDAGAKLAVLPAIATRWYGFQQSYPEASVL